MANKLFPKGQLHLAPDGKLTFGGGRTATFNAMKYARPPIADFRIFKYTSTWQSFGSMAVVILHFTNHEETQRYQGLISALSPPM